MRAALLAAPLLLLAGCGQPDAPLPEPLKGGALTPGENPRYFNYSCDPAGGGAAERAQATYGINSLGKPNVILSVRTAQSETLVTDGRPTAEGTRYVRNGLLREGHATVWLNRGATAELRERPVAGGAETLLLTCKIAPSPK